MAWKFNKRDDTIGAFFMGMKPYWSRFLGDLWPWRWIELTHSALNLPVEAARLSPYQFGHIVFFTHLILLTVIITLVL